MRSLALHSGTTFLVLMLSLLGAVPAQADLNFSLEAVAVRSTLDTNVPGLDEETDTFGGRFVARFAGRLGIEVLATQTSFDGALPTFGVLPIAVPVELDLETVDLSLRFSLVRRPRFDLFAFAGAGYIGAEVRTEVFGFAFEATGETATWHYGIGAEIGLGTRFFVRPDIRQRELGDEDTEGFLFEVGGEPFNIDLGVEYGVSLGIRF